eukprot:TRINITY_DN79991_c0_g1_i1.p1 TRINITY_DN79991_c0_g1~~TRINITY_DN79991_c0_g1_i1.p1  ORF type:complete len:541 (+),score=119.84 TRINITY_DN79991_c0_g1_i1:125-1747(+)
MPGFQIKRLADKLPVYQFKQSSLPHAPALLAVLCDDPKEEPFPHVANLMLAIFGFQSSKDMILENWDRDSAKHADSTELNSLATALEEADGPDFALWNFAVCTVGMGPLRGMRAVAIGSNVKKRERAGNLALVLTAYLQSPSTVLGCDASFISDLAARVSASVTLAGHDGNSDDADVPSPAALPQLQPPIAHGENQEPTSPVDVPSTPVVYSLARKKQTNKMPGYATTSSITNFLQEDELRRSSENEPCSRDEVSANASLREASVDSDRSEIIMFQAPQSEGLTGSAAEMSLGLDYWDGREPLASDLEHDRICQLLARHDAEDDAFTIRSLCTADTIPVGTDLGPDYNNAWAADKIQNPMGKILLTHDLGRRVLDAENIGFTYGHRVLGKDKHFAVEGVKKAVAYYLEDGCNVVVVGQRSNLQDDLRTEVETGYCDIVIADNVDDVIILKKAFELRCPVVSRDKYRAQLDDLRICRKLRQWYAAAGSTLQVNYTFDANGNFMPNNDLPMPVLRPRSQEDHKPDRSKLRKEKPRQCRARAA